MLSTVDGPKWPYWIYILHILLIGTGLYKFCNWVELPVQRRLCPIFFKVASGNPTSTSIPRVDGWSTDPRVSGRYNDGFVFII